MHFFQFPPFWKWDYSDKRVNMYNLFQNLYLCIKILHFGTGTVEFWGVQCSTCWKYVKSQILDILWYFRISPVQMIFFNIFLSPLFNTDQRIISALFWHQLFEILHIFIFTILSNNWWYSCHIHAFFIHVLI